ncbi:Uncharacterised protein [uncultured archaeon]|nr:Uncharacterised protein [uncultured archaeon]
MKKTILITLTFLLVLQLVSAAVVISEQPKNIYNYGEIVKVPVKIIASGNINNFLIVELNCGEKVLELNKDPILLYTGEEKDQTYSIPLTKTFVQDTTGNCKVKFSLGPETQYTNEFKVSNSIAINLKETNSTVAPLDKVVIEGTATKENSEKVNGFAEVSLTHPDLTSSINILGTVKDSEFMINFSLPKETKARKYTVMVSVYEKDLEGNTNNIGTTTYLLSVKQIPTSLELTLDKPLVEPKSDEKVKAILYDQAGEKISSKVTFQVRNGDNKLIQEVEKDTEEVLTLPVTYNEPPAKWKIVAESLGVSNEASFEINTHEEVITDIQNNTVIFTNVGNVPYIKTVTVKIGDTPKEIALNLGVDKSETYLLTAPEGTYNIEANGVTGSAILTGKAIDVKKAPGQIMSLFTGAGNYVVWAFIIIVLVLAFIILFRRLFRRKYSAYKASKYHTRDTYVAPVYNKKELVQANNKAEMAVSIKGEQMTATAVCIKIRNMAAIRSRAGIEETLQKAVDIAEMSKAHTYESHDGLVFLFVPFKTKTMQNERTATSVAERIKDVLAYHNKVYKDKLDFGISVENGQIIAKNKPGQGMIFTPLNNFIVNAKKIASSSQGQVVVGDSARQKPTRITGSGSGDVEKFMTDFKSRNRYNSR